MKWKNRKQSTNVEDRRHEKPEDKTNAIAVERRKIEEARKRIEQRTKYKNMSKIRIQK